MTEPRFFRSQKEWRAWLEKNHDKKAELLLGFHKKKTGTAGLTYKQAVDEALCFGWIDGRGQGGDLTWTVRFTPRKKRSIWSQVNIRRIDELKSSGLMHPAGLAVFENRDPKLQKLYSHENKDAGLPPAYEKKFRAQRTAWAAFRAMAPSYRKAANRWVTGAKQEETRLRRLEILIADSAAGQKIRPLTPPPERRARDKK